MDAVLVGNLRVHRTETVQPASPMQMLLARPLAIRDPPRSGPPSRGAIRVPRVRIGEARSPLVAAVVPPDAYARVIGRGSPLPQGPRGVNQTLLIREQREVARVDRVLD